MKSTPASTKRKTPDGVKDAKKLLARVDTSITATAVYDFEAFEENMISFKKNDRITDIKAYTGGWWHGKCHGKSGTFPANLVVLDMS